jgi:hypothetical protein
VAQGEHPEFKPQYGLKKKKEFRVLLSLEEFASECVRRSGKPNCKGRGTLGGVLAMGNPREGNKTPCQFFLFDWSLGLISQL